MTPVQAVHVDEERILGRYRGKTAKSAECFRRAQLVTPGGVMGEIKFFEPYPLVMERGSGSHLWDVDGNEYVDYLMSYGAIVVGHGDALIREAVRSALGSFGTTVVGTPTELEAEYGEELRDIYHPGGMSRFTNSGLEATLLTTRVAKAYTGRRKVAKFEGHYHGAVDRLLFSYTPGLESTGPPDAPVAVRDSTDVDDGILAESVTLPFNDLDRTVEIITRHAQELACVIMEPFLEGVIPAEQSFMSGLRRATKELGVPLIFDEVKTGFRVRAGGASEYYSVVPDLTCLGKIAGGGLPIGVVVGDPEMMKLLDPRNARGRKVFHSGTFNGNPLSLTVGKAVVEALRRGGRFDELRGRTEELKRGLAESLREHHVPADFEGEGGMFNFYLTDGPVRNYRDVMKSDRRLRRFVDIELLTRGVYLKPQGRFCLSLSHSAEDVAKTVEEFSQSLDSVFGHQKH